MILKKIASQINDLRLELTCRFIQVTATPYSSRYYSDMPYNKDHDLRIAREMAQTEPTLMLMKQNGNSDEEHGWRGAEFYWPVLVAPENIDTAVYSASEK